MDYQTKGKHKEKQSQQKPESYNKLGATGSLPVQHGCNVKMRGWGTTLLANLSPKHVILVNNVIICLFEAFLYTYTLR